MKKAVVAPLSEKTTAKKRKSDKMVDCVFEKMAELILTPADIEKIEKVRFNDIPEARELERQEGESIFETIAKLAIPFIRNTLPKVLGTLGLEAATGCVQAAVRNKVSGKGIRMVGGTIKVTKGQLEDVMKLGNIAEECGCMKTSLVNPIVQDIRKLSGGLLVSLLVV